jgi:hypothetical protein
VGVSAGDKEVQPATQLSREDMAPPHAYGSLSADTAAASAAGSPVDVPAAPAVPAVPAATPVPRMQGTSMPAASTATGFLAPRVQQQQQQQQVPAAVATAAAAPRHVCEGGVMVAAAGNRYKCKYRRSSTAAMPAGAYPAGTPAQPYG